MSLHKLLYLMEKKERLTKETAKLYLQTNAKKLNISALCKAVCVDRTTIHKIIHNQPNPAGYELHFPVMALDRLEDYIQSL